jgi:hypothetical protein
VVATTFSLPAESLDAGHYVVGDLTGVRVENDSLGLALKLTPLSNL